ncbi:cell division protein FtsZ, partial [Isoptericola sp. QY 916]|nr:cell division protein FtsZ [Isoptericola sp. QY 916]
TASVPAAAAQPRPIPAEPDDVPVSLDAPPAPPAGARPAEQRRPFTVVEDAEGEGVTVERPVEVPRLFDEPRRPAEELDVPDFLK